MVTRRQFLKLSGAAAGSALAAPGISQASLEAHRPHPDALGCLVDLTLCIGCRMCEAGCNETNSLPKPEKPFEDKSVLAEFRRMDIDQYTVVNRFAAEEPKAKDVHVKAQCMHCVDPACVSACPPGAMLKRDDGPVTWDNIACIGCRYCMIACPFGVPAYEYYKGIEPRVMKCTFCWPRLDEGKPPGCVEACPMETLKLGPRAKLLEVARERIRKNPDRYVDHVYGEHEVGGTSWLYLAPQDFSTLGFLDLPDDAPPRLTEAIQHGVFKYFAAPVLLFAGLGALMAITKDRSGGAEKHVEPPETPEESAEETPEGSVEPTEEAKE